MINLFFSISHPRTMPARDMHKRRPYVHAPAGCAPITVVQEVERKVTDILMFSSQSGNPMQSDMVAVDSRFFLGAARHAQDGAVLAQRGITHVINCASGCCPNSAAQRYKENNIKFLSLDANDAPDYRIIESHLDDVFDFLEDCVNTPNSKCLVHCYQGLNRSATLLTAYLVVKYRRPLLCIVERLRAVRSCILSNRGFRVQLVELAFMNGLLGSGYPLPRMVATDTPVPTTKSSEVPKITLPPAKTLQDEPGLLVKEVEAVLVAADPTKKPHRHRNVLRQALGALVKPRTPRGVH